MNRRSARRYLLHALRCRLDGLRNPLEKGFQCSGLAMVEFHDDLTHTLEKAFVGRGTGRTGDDVPALLSPTPSAALSQF